MTTKPEQPEPKFITLRREDVRRAARIAADEIAGLDYGTQRAECIEAAIIAAAVEVPECIPNFRCGLNALMRDAAPLPASAGTEEQVAEVRRLHAAILACRICREVAEEWKGPGMCERHAAETATLLKQHFAPIPDAPKPQPSPAEVAWRFDDHTRDFYPTVTKPPAYRPCVGCGHSWERCCGRLENVGDRCCSACAHPGTSKPHASATFRYCTATVTRQSEPIPSQHNGETAYNIGPCGNALPCSVHPYLLLNPPYSDPCDIDAYRHGFRDGWKERERPKPAASNEPANLGLYNLPVLRRVTHADKQRVAELLANVAPASTPLRTELRTGDELPCVATDTTEADPFVPPAPVAQATEPRPEGGIVDILARQIEAAGLLRGDYAETRPLLRTVITRYLSRGEHPAPPLDARALAEAIADEAGKYADRSNMARNPGWSDIRKAALTIIERAAGRK